MAEELHNKWRGTEKRVTDEFVNPGTSPTAFVQMSQRKHARVEGANQSLLQSKAMNANNL